MAVPGLQICDTVGVIRGENDGFDQERAGYWLPHWLILRRITEENVMKAVLKRYARSLDLVVERLADLAGLLQSEGLEEQAKSIETTIADLQWQCEELDSEQLEVAS